MLSHNDLGIRSLIMEHTQNARFLLMNYRFPDEYKEVDFYFYFFSPRTKEKKSLSGSVDHRIYWEWPYCNLSHKTYWFPSCYLYHLFVSSVISSGTRKWYFSCRLHAHSDAYLARKLWAHGLKESGIHRFYKMFWTGQPIQNLDINRKLPVTFPMKFPMKIALPRFRKIVLL